jgi:cytochrome oxidase assembly protein ShyY1
VFRVLLSPVAIGVHLLAVVATGAAVWLGAWQYGVWQAHRADQAQQLAHAPAKPLARVMGSDDPFPGGAVGQPVELSGAWLPGETFFVAGKRLDGRSGYWVVTPVAVCRTECASRAADAPAMLVVRGWTSGPGQAPAPPDGRVDVTGWLQPAEGSGRVDPHPRDDVVPELRVASVLQRFDQDLYGGYVLSEAHEPGLRPVTPAALPAPSTFTGLRNLLYAVEWWFFGGFALFMWWRWCRDAVSVRDGDGDGGGDGGGSSGGEDGSPGQKSAQDAEVASRP